VPETLAELIREQVAEQPDRPALTFEGQTWTYREIDERASRTAQGLLALGVQPGDRIATVVKNVPAFFDVLFGAAKIAAVTCPVNWRLSPREVVQIVNDASAKVLLISEEFSDALTEVEDQLTTVKVSFVVAADDRHDVFGEWRDTYPADDPRVPFPVECVALQYYTSGTTGLPKGVMLSNANLFALTDVMNDQTRFTEDSVNLVVMPLFHVAGAGWATYGFSFGAHNVMHRDIDLAAILRDIEHYHVTHALFVPAVLQFLLLTPGVESTDFSSLELILYGASPISQDVLVRGIETFRCRFVQAYGLTETDGAVVLLPAEDHDPNGPNRHRLEAAGPPMRGVELRIVAPDGTECGTGEVGEVWIRSPRNMVGYWNMPEATAAVITPDGWFKSGDAGYLDADGYLYIHDRVKDMIISGAENIYPAEVESILMEHPAVADVAVIGVPDEQWGEAVKGIVVRTPDADVTDSELITFCRDRLAHFKCPSSIDWAESLPRNPSGKLLKKDLREPYWRGRERRVN